MAVLRNVFSAQGLIALFDAWSEPARLATLHAELAPEDVPTWADFTRGVVDAVRSA